MVFFDFENQLNKAESHSDLQGVIKGIGRPIGLIAILLAAIALLGYVLDVEFLFRPLANGPATNPLTAIVVLLIALSLELGYYSPSKKVPLVLASIAVTICVLHSLDLLTDNSLIASFVPFQDIVAGDLALGKGNAMGINTSVMLLLLALSHVLYIVKYPVVSQLLSFTALCFPVVSITGYAYGLTAFYGSMSLLSTTFGVFLCVAILVITADKGGLKALLSPHIGGKIARIQILLGYLVPLFIGYLVIRSLVSSSQNSLFGVYVVSICWFIALLVVVSAVVQEKVDSKRRLAESILQHNVMTDELTQLPNRRYFMDTATAKFHQVSTLGPHLDSWFLMVDIDHFKKVNDSAGHEAGDKVLVAFAKCLTDFVGSDDIVCRLGGEEFAFYLQGMTKSEVTKIAEEILLAVSRLDIPGYTELHGHITTSIGGTHAKGKADVDHALRLADNALYTSKSSGRNQCSFA